MAVSAIDPFAPATSTTKTATTRPVTTTPTPTVQPQLVPQQAPRAATATATAAPGVMDPLAFQPVSPYQDAQGNWDVSTQAGMEAMWAAKAAGIGNYDLAGTSQPPPTEYGASFNRWNPTDPGRQFAGTAMSATTGAGTPNFQFLNYGESPAAKFGNIDPASLASMTPEQRNALAQQMYDAYSGYAVMNQGQDKSLVGGPAGTNFGWSWAPEQAMGGGDRALWNSLVGTYSPNAILPNNTATISNDPYRTIQGGQTFTDPVAGQNAFDAILQQMANGGPALFTSQQPGGTINSDALRQLQTGLSDASGQSRVYSEFLPGGGADYRATPPGTASDIGGGGNVPGGGGTMPNPWVPGTGTGGGGSGGTGGTGTDTGGTGSGLGPGLSLIDPSNDLRNFQITPGAMLDRFKLAGEQFDTFANATSPQYQAALRDANRAAAATGRLGSGMLRTSYGDLANQRNLQLDTQRENLFQNALLGSVQDAQTQFEDYLRSQAQLSGMQNQALNQGIQGATLQEALTSGAFSCALQQLGAGNQVNAYDEMLTMSKIFGDQSSASGSAMSVLLQSIMSGGGSTDTLLRQILTNQQLPSGTLPQSSQTLYDTPVFS